MKKYISLSFLSLLGYLCFIVTFIFLVVVIPITYKLDLIKHDGGLAFFSFSSLILIKFYILHLILSILIILIFLIEFLLKKGGKIIKIPNFSMEHHPYIFKVGIFGVFIPFYWLIILYIFPIIFSS